MLHRGSIRWMVGSSMYSKARLPGTLALSTLRPTCTGPALVADGGEKHTISAEALLRTRETLINALDRGSDA